MNRKIRPSLQQYIIDHVSTCIIRKIPSRIFVICVNLLVMGITINRTNEV